MRLAIYDNLANLEPYCSAIIDSPLGRLGLIATNNGLGSILWQDELDYFDITGNTPVDSNPILKQTSRQLIDYFMLRRSSFDLPVDLRGTPFQVEAWRALAKIPYGKTINYRQQAISIQRPRAARAVGRANRFNPLPIVLPCHRVIKSDGSLSGFSGGLDSKLYLLRHEGYLG